MNQAQSSLQQPLLVELSGSGLRHVFELAELDDRAYLVGSSRQADFRIDRPDVAAVEFHVERVGSDAWLVPAYRGRGLRVNGVPVRTSVRIDGRLILELGPYGLELRVLPEGADVAEASRSSSAPRPLPADYTHTVPTDTACTAVAMKPFDTDPSANIPTQQVPVLRASPAVVAPQQTQRMAPIRPAALQALQHTERLAPIATPPPLASEPYGGGLFETQRLAPVTAPVAPPMSPPPARIFPVSIRPIEAPPAQPQGDPAPLTTQETTSFDIAAVAIGTLEVASAGVAQTAAPPLPARTKSADRADRARAPQLVSWKAFLTRLGTLAKDRPTLVVGGGLVGALVLALALVGATRIVEPTRRAPAGDKAASSAKSATPPPVLASAAAAGVTPAPALVVVPTPPANPKRGSKGAADPVLAAAVTELAAGRLAEGSQAYGALASRPSGQVYTKLAALLARRASADCSGSSTSTHVHCPELLK
jgi:hypothetical protein